MCFLFFLLNNFLCRIICLFVDFVFVCGFVFSPFSQFLIDFNNTVNFSYKPEACHEANGAGH